MSNKSRSGGAAYIPAVEPRHVFLNLSIWSTGDSDLARLRIDKTIHNNESPSMLDPSVDRVVDVLHNHCSRRC
jgi:hypothetical protein